jgi:hypothetical protein
MGVLALAAVGPWAVEAFGNSQAVRPLADSKGFRPGGALR